MAPRQQQRTPYGAGGKTARSVRVSDEVWDLAKRRATFDDTTISTVAATLIEGYARGQLSLPKIEVSYTQPQ